MTKPIALTALSSPITIGFNGSATWGFMSSTLNSRFGTPIIGSGSMSIKGATLLGVWDANEIGAEIDLAIDGSFTKSFITGIYLQPDGGGAYTYLQALSATFAVTSGTSQWQWTGVSLPWTTNSVTRTLIVQF